MQIHLKRHTKQTNISFCGILFGLLLNMTLLMLPQKEPENIQILHGFCGCQERQVLLLYFIIFYLFIYFAFLLFQRY